MAEAIINGITVPFLPPGGIDGLKERFPVQAGGAGRPFGDILQEEINELTWSRHARERLESRNIVLNDSDITSLRQAVDRADQKGARDSLVLLRNLAFIVNVQNRTVVTAVEAGHLRDNVFTNIDSAVIA